MRLPFCVLAVVYLCGVVYTLDLDEAVHQCAKDRMFLKTQWTCDPGNYLSQGGRDRVSYYLNKLQSAACPCDEQSLCDRRRQVLKNTQSDATELTTIPAAYTGVLLVVDQWNKVTLERDASLLYQNELQMAAQPGCDTGLLFVFNIRDGMFYTYRGNETTRQLTQDELLNIMNRAANFRSGANTTAVLDNRALMLAEDTADALLYDSIDEHALSGWIGWVIAVAVATLAIILILTVACSKCCKSPREKRVSALKKSLKQSPVNTIYAVPPSLHSPAFGSAQTEPIYVISEPSTTEDLNTYQAHTHPYFDPPFIDPNRQLEYQSRRMAVF